MGKQDIYTTSGKRWERVKPEARRMRHEPTPGEEALWQLLRGGVQGARFRRQHAIGRFIVDFVCLPHRLVVEVDGTSHAGLERRDEERDSFLRAAGFAVIRFSNQQVLTAPEAVAAEIRVALRRSPDSWHGSPSPHGEQLS
jgi:very-short-patch-repair endonuclease